MKKRLAGLLLVIVIMVASVAVAVPAAAEDQSWNIPEITIPEKLAVPDNDLLTDGVEYYLAEGSRWQQKVTTDFMADGFKSRTHTYNYQKYLIVHNTGAYPTTSTALANHNYGKTTTAEVSWHFTTGNDGIYQMLPANEKGWHAGGNYWGTDDPVAKAAKGWISDCSNSTGLGFETATPGFPADQTSAGEHWNKPEMYEWYESTYDKTATYLAELLASICVRLNFNPYTQIAQHYSSAAKNCPMQMRYVFGTNAQFTFHGTYFDVMLDRLYDFYKAFGGSYVETDTCQNTYYNPNGIVYKKGLYKVSENTTVYRAGNTTTETVGTVSANDIVDVKIVGFDWGKITLADGKEGWIKLTGLTYVTGDYDYGTYKISVESTEEPAPGDTDGDGIIDNKDAVTILQYETDIVHEIKNGDVNGDGRISNLDATIILQYDAGMRELPALPAAAAAGTTDKVVNITKIDGTTGYYDGGTVDMSKATRVYKVEVVGDTAFGSEAKYLASGETFEVTAAPAEGIQHFDMWETVSGVVTIADQHTDTTTMTVLKSDVKVTSTYTDKQHLTVEYGTGSGSYLIGTKVSISSLARPGKVFTHWTIKEGEGTFENENVSSTTFTIGSKDTVIAAVYEDKAFPDLTGFKNYSVGKSYTFTWKGNQKDKIAWYNTLSTDNEGVRLTDGKVADSNFALGKGIYVGVLGTAGTGEVVIDLGAPTKVTHVIIRDAEDNGGSIGDIQEGSAAVSVSSDNSEFSPVEAFTDNMFFSWKVNDDGSYVGIGDETLKTHVLSFSEVEAQYIKLTFKSKLYVYVMTEVEVWGPENQG